MLYRGVARGLVIVNDHPCFGGPRFVEAAATRFPNGSFCPNRRVLQAAVLTPLNSKQCAGKEGTLGRTRVRSCESMFKEVKARKLGRVGA